MGTFLGFSGWVILACVTCFAVGALVGRPIVNWLARKAVEFTK